MKKQKGGAHKILKAKNNVPRYITYLTRQPHATKDAHTSYLSVRTCGVLVMTVC